MIEKIWSGESPLWRLLLSRSLLCVLRLVGGVYPCHSLGCMAW